MQLARMQTLGINVSPHFDQGFMEKILSELNADLLLSYNVTVNLFHSDLTQSFLPMGRWVRCNHRILTNVVSSLPKIDEYV